MRYAIALAIAFMASNTVMAQSAETVVAAIDACRERLDPQIDIGYERISARCPELAKRLEQNSFTAWLPEGWQDSGNNLSAGSLNELSVLIQREIATQSSRPAPSVQHLHSVLAEIGQSAQQRGGLWKRVRLWLHKVFPTQDEPADTGWIPRMVSRIGLSQTVIELITYFALAVVIGLGAWIVTHELRAAGILRNRRKRSVTGEPLSGNEAPVVLSWRDVELAPFIDKPRMLLELLTDRLTRAQRLPPARSLTTRELTRVAKFTEQKDHARLQTVALVAERIKYASSGAQPAEINAAIDSGRQLLRSLDPAMDEAAR